MAQGGFWALRSGWQFFYISDWRLSEQAKVPLEDYFALEYRVKGSCADEGSEGEFGGEHSAFAGGGSDEDECEGCCGEDGEGEGEERERGSEPGCDHGEEFDVSRAEALTAAEEIVGSADEEQDERRERGPEDR